MQKPTLQTILISILIIVALFVSIYFPYKWKQLSNDFLGQTSHYGELLKQINDLEKEVRELRNGDGEIEINEIQVGEFPINYDDIVKIQKSIDEGHQPWHMDSQIVVFNTAKNYGFIEDDCKTMKNVLFNAENGIAKYEITHKEKSYVITVVQPVIGNGKIWTISKIEESFFQDKIADWQIYQNKEYGFKFKYPENWNSKTLKDDTFVIQCEHGFCDFNFAVYFNSENFSLDEFYKNKFSLFNLLKTENILLGEYRISASKFIYKTKEAATPDSKVIVATKKGEYIIEIEDVYGRSLDSNFKEFNQILSTFKFIE